MTNTPISNDLPIVCDPIVCDLTALTADERLRLESLSVELFKRVTAIDVLDDGYQLTWSDSSPGILADLAEFVAYDSRCCAFLEHSITVGAGQGPALLHLRGGPGAREAIAEDLARGIPHQLATAAGLS